MKAAWLLLASAPLFAETLLILHKQADSVGIYNGDTGERLKTIAVGVRPHEMEWSADHKLLFVTNYGLNSYTETTEGGHTLSIVDPAAAKSVGEIDLGAYHRPHGIERGQRLLYVTVDHPPAILAIDPNLRSVVRAYELASKLPHMLAVTKDEKTLFVANAGSASVTVLTLKTGAKQEIEVGGVPMGVALSKDERTVYVATRDGGAVVVIDAAARKVSARIEIAGMPARVRLLPDGKRLLVSLIGAGDTVILDVASQQILTRFHSGGASEGLGSDSTGTVGYVSAQGENKVVKFSLKDGKPIREILTLARPDPIFVWQKPLR